MLCPPRLKSTSNSDAATLLLPVLEMDPSIRFSSATELITPSTPTPQENLHLPLTNLDVTSIRIFTPLILLYHPPSSDFQMVVANLKESLRRALVEYYPFAGRVVKGHNGLPEVRCDDSGAFFTEVVVEQELAEFEAEEPEFWVQMTGMEAAGLSCRGSFSLNEYHEIPPLVIQVTCFKCKAIAMAVNWYHPVADGGAGMSFLKAWSELAQGLPITSPPDHRRHLLSPRTPLQPLEVAPPCYKIISSHQSPTKVDTRVPKKVEFTISLEEIQQLKNKAAETGFTCTSGECISAHIWRLVTRARASLGDYCKNDQAITSMYTVIGARKRMKVDFPVGYFGNCILFKRASCSMTKLLEMPLGHVAKLIQDSISGVSDEYVRALVDWMEVAGAQNVALHRGSYDTYDLRPTFWRYFPIYEMDFGFGRPRFAGRNTPLEATTPGRIVVGPTPFNDGSVLVAVYLYSDAADQLAAILKLPKDDEF